MPWLPNYDQGRTPADYTAGAGMSVHNGGQPIQRRNQWADAIAKIAPQVMAYLKQKKQDEIANALMNMEQPPRAEAVDPSLQGAPATRPFTGGADGFKVHQMYQDFMNKQQDRQYELQSRQPDTQMDDLDYQIKYRQAHPEEFPEKASEYVNTPQGRMTAHQWAVIQEGQRKSQAKGIGGLTLDQLNQPDYVRYEDANGNQLSTDQANADPEHAFARPPGAKGATPYKQWNAAAQMFRDAQSKASPAPKVMGQPTDQAKAATSDNDAVLRDARDAISRGKDPVAVKKRLQEMGIDPAGL